MIKSGQAKSEREKKRRFELKKLKFRKVKTWVLLVILVPLLFIDATLLRFDHLRMVSLREAVMTADEQGDTKGIRNGLAELKDFVFHNMVINVVEENGEQRVTFGTGPFYLENQYVRDANQALEEAESQLANDANPNGNVYQMASNVCSPQAIANGWDWNTPDYINCMMGEINKYPAAEDLNDQVMASLPSTELYRLNFASPVWAPTVTGFCILATVLILLVILVRAVIWIFLRISLLFM